MPISLFSDILSLLTLHIYSFYIASARIFHWQLTIIISLFHLFRGKKRNILRNRIDSCDYDLDQLLLGTILFTLQFFLLPTVFVFYLTFASARVAVIALKAGLEIGLACLNHFPLFAVMLRLKDSRRLPGMLDRSFAHTMVLTSHRWYLFRVVRPQGQQVFFSRRSRLSTNSLRSSQSKPFLCLPLCEPTNNYRSLCLYLLVPCFSLTLSSGTAYGNTTSRQESSLASLRANSFLPFIEEICTVCSIACSQPIEPALASSGGSL